MYKLIYSLCASILSLPLGLLFLLRERGRTRLAERFGFWSVKLDGCIWFHGASVGEINSLLPIVSLVQKAGPHAPILITSTSSTGLERAQGVTPWLRLLPFDAPPWIGQALATVRPKIFISAETELWPCLFWALSKRGVPIHLVNARISDTSWPWYRRITFFLKGVLAQVSRVNASTKNSAERFLELGCAADRVEVVGNAKYDIEPAITSKEDMEALRHTFFADAEMVLVLGSIRPGEEIFWFKALQEFGSAGGKMNVIVAPRHKEKFEYFATALTKYGLPFRRYSDRSPLRSECIVLLDSIGELMQVYSFSNLAFIGGTLEKFGGHHPLEPAVYGNAIIIGSHVSNISDIVQVLEARGGCLRADSVGDLRAILERSTQDLEWVRGVGESARAVWQENRGAAHRIFERLGLS